MRDDVLPHLHYSYLFNLHTRLIKKIEPILAKKISIKKDRSLTPDRILKLIAGITEQPIQRPKHGQKKSYSGNKKQHTLKTEIIIEEGGRILSVSKSYRGKVHDFRIRKQERLLSIDCGYQGWHELQFLSRGTTAEQKEHILFEWVLSIRLEKNDGCRNFQVKYNMRFNTIAG